MRLRTFALFLLFAVGVVPILLAGFLVIRRARRTALDEVQQGNHRVAVRAASELDGFARRETALLSALGAPLTRSVEASPQQVRRILKNYRILFPNLRTLDIVGFGRGCHEAFTSRIDPALHDRCDDPAAKAALKGQTYLGDIILSEDFTPVMTIAVPLEVAGELLGGAIADVDMVAIVPAVKQVRVGQSGYARLVSRDGTLIAVGDPEERRRVFMREKDAFIDRVRAAPPGVGVRYENSQHRDVIALSASLSDLGWTVVVEQPIDEAFHAAHLMQRELAITLVVGAGLALIIGLLIGSPLIRILDRMRRHARVVAAGDLQTRIAPLPPFKEFKQLAVDLNDMTAEIKRLHDDMKARERLSTFARVAAGLAHDLQTPIESVRGACEMMLAKPSDDTARELLRSASQNHLPRLHRYVRDLRRLAADGKVPLELVSVKPRALAERVVAESSASPKWQGIEFVAEGEAANIWADESLLRRAVSNLAANAADACVMRRPPQGRVTVRVADDPDDDALLIIIEDTGVGIPADKLADLMINDFRSTKRNSGVGLGLGVARHVAASHGGNITAQSAEGTGSTFTVRLPRQAVAGIAAEADFRKGVSG